MRTALSAGKLRSIYGRIARHYDVQHGILTAHSDQRGRRLLIDRAVQAGDRVLDCGTGTGSTGLMAAQKVGTTGKVTLLDLSEDMLAMARKKADRAGLSRRLEFQTGDMGELPFRDNCFDTVLSTYSLCPLSDPAKAALELYRVTRPGGRIGAAHSTQPRNPIVRWLANQFENLAWQFPSLSMGCRAVEVLPALERAGAKTVFVKHIGVPLWPFIVFVCEKPAGN